MYSRLQEVAGDDLALHIVDNVHGVCSNLGVIVDALCKLKDECKMKPSDLCKFMAGSVAAAVVDPDKAVAFWAGLEMIRFYFTPSELATFICDGIATRLKNGQVQHILEVIKRFGTKLAKTYLTRQPLQTTNEAVHVLWFVLTPDDNLAVIDIAKWDVVPCVKISEFSRVVNSLESRAARQTQALLNLQSTMPGIA